MAFHHKKASAGHAEFGVGVFLLLFFLCIPSIIHRAPQYLPPEVEVPAKIPVPDKHKSLVQATVDPGSFSVPDELNTDVPGAITPYPFPCPDGLKAQVEFWRKIFTEYTTSHVVIHDDWYVNVVYEVINIRSSRFRTRRDGWKAVKAAQKRYKKLLKNLWKEGRGLDKMTDEEERLYSLFENIPESTRFRKQDAKDRVRAQLGLADKFMAGIVRAGSYLGEMKRIFSLHGLPEELVFIALVESAFNPHARSHLGASGMWQFMPRTGEEYNLRARYLADERKDPYLATLAAAQLLAHNYDIIQSWPLAISAYNHGLHGILKAVDRLQSMSIAVIAEHYNGRAFRFASRNFYAEFLAALEVSKWYTEYYGIIELSKPLKPVRARVPHYVAVKTLEEYCFLSASDIKELNPVLEPSVFKPEGLIPKGYHLNLWPAQRDAFKSNYSAIPSSLKYRHIEVKAEHRVKKRESLAKIAKMYHTTVAGLKRMNNLGGSRKIKVGQVLKIPGDYVPLDHKENLKSEGKAGISEKQSDKRG